MSDHELKLLADTFAKMGDKPKFDSKEDIEAWMVTYVKGLEQPHMAINQPPIRHHPL